MGRQKFLLKPSIVATVMNLKANSMISLVFIFLILGRNVLDRLFTLLRETDMKKIFLSILLATLIPIIFFIGIEVVCLFSGINTHYRQTKPSSIVREDMTFGYRVREKLSLTVPRLILNRELTELRESINHGTFTVETEQYGFRSLHRVSRDRQDNTFRVICYGDSTTFGWGEDNDKTYPALLAAIASENKLNIEVINAGQPGFSSYQALIYYQKFLNEFSANLIVLSFGHNDHHVAIQGHNTARGKIEFLTENPGKLRLILRKTESFLLWERIIGKITGKLSSVLVREKQNYDNPGSVSQFEEHIVGLISAMKKNKTIPLLMTQPICFSNEIAETYNDTIRSIAFQHSVPLIDPVPVFENKIAQFRHLDLEENKLTPSADAQTGSPALHYAEQLGLPNELFWDNIHLTSKGNAILARQVFQVLKSNNVLPEQNQDIGTIQ